LWKEKKTAGRKKKIAQIRNGLSEGDAAHKTSPSSVLNKLQKKEREIGPGPVSGKE